MTGAEDSTDRAAEPVACPECGEAELVQKISAIPDWPAEYGPPDRPGWFDLLGVVSLVGGLLLAVALAYVVLSVAPDLDLECIALVALPPIVFGLGRLRYKGQQRSKWKEGMRFWKRLYFCPRDEVAFIPGGTSTCPLHEVRDLLADQKEWAGFAPKPKRFADFSPMPEELEDSERMVKETKEKSGNMNDWAGKAEGWIRKHPRIFWAVLLVIGVVWFFLCIVPFGWFLAMLALTGG